MVQSYSFELQIRLKSMQAEEREVFPSIVDRNGSRINVWIANRFGMSTKILLFYLGTHKYVFIIVIITLFLRWLLSAGRHHNKIQRCSANLYNSITIILVYQKFTLFGKDSPHLFELPMLVLIMQQINLDEQKVLHRRQKGISVFMYSIQLQYTLNSYSIRKEFRENGVSCRSCQSDIHILELNERMRLYIQRFTLVYIFGREPKQTEGGISYRNIYLLICLIYTNHDCEKVSSLRFFVEFFQIIKNKNGLALTRCNFRRFGYYLYGVIFFFIFNKNIDYILN
eukprot:TRINITY_DN5904_c0_g1_i5.p1 TRINITY_DN5904_c0_g1~~TRINITY_DN5904_c0_g1_i5.p1  ORF type:complete len:283 (-),score=-17.21 TRINITY_DN5904_c0_g1_i5:58-906(-)